MEHYAYKRTACVCECACRREWSVFASAVLCRGIRTQQPVQQLSVCDHNCVCWCVHKRMDQCMKWGTQRVIVWGTRNTKEKSTIAVPIQNRTPYNRALLWYFMLNHVSVRFWAHHRWTVRICSESEFVYFFSIVCELYWKWILHSCKRKRQISKWTHDE